MALGNQVCKGIKALLAAAAPIKQIDKIKIKSGFKCGIILKIVDKDKSENKPIVLVYQKLTN